MIIRIDTEKAFRCRGPNYNPNDSILARSCTSQGLIELYRSIPNITECTLIEIGCLCGESSIIAATFCKKVYCIDIWCDSYFGTEPDEFDPENVFDILASWYSNITKMKGSSAEHVGKFEDGSADIIYLDSHKAVETIEGDIRGYWPKLKVGGYFCGHDYGKDGADANVKLCVDRMLGVPDHIFGDTSWLVKKTDEKPKGEL